MISSLQVENLAIIESLDLHFGPGLNVLSGETGAGKSVILGALGLVLGGRGSTDLVRTGARCARVHAVFQIGGQERVIERTVPARGSGRSTLDGQPATLPALQELGRQLLDFSGQHEHRVLLEPEAHRSLLDRFAGARLGPVLRAWEAYAQARSELRRLERALHARTERMDYLRFQLRELDELAPRDAEHPDLLLEREQLAHAEQLREGARAAESQLYSSEGSVCERLVRAESLLARLGEVDPEHRRQAEQLAELHTLVEDLARELQSTLRRYADPHRLDEVEERLDAYRKLGRKHNCLPEELPQVREAVDAELLELDEVEIRLVEAQRGLERAELALTAATQKLRATRSKAARKLDRAVNRELAALAMPEARFVTVLEACDPGPEGADQVTFHLSANPGEEPRPVHRVASGGELSRILLALKLVLRGAHGVSTFVFDEIDSGIGGRTADVVGAKLRELAGHGQILCISHLPQIASLADRHFVVAKSVRGGRTRSTVQQLDHQGRVEELARMLGGAALGGVSRDYAEQLIQAYAKVA